MMKNASFLDFVEQYPKYGDGLSTDRMSRGVEWLKARHGVDFPPVVHVVGSNGKGSSCHILEAALGHLGLRVGMFISPHYYVFNERFRLGGVNVSDDALAASVESVREITKQLEGIGGFEVMTLIAADLFLRETARGRLDVLVVEAGVGGRFDATRVFGGRVGILTSVDLEHTEILGESLGEIAADKIDVTAPGGGIVTGWLPDGLAEFCRDHAEGEGRWLVDISDATRCEFESVAEIAVTTVVDAETLAMTWHPATPVDYLPRNALLGLHAVANLKLENVRGRDLATAFSAAVRETKLIGRFERLSDAPVVICDFAHTPAAAREVVTTCKRVFAERRIICVVGISHDKNHADMLRVFTGAWSEFLAFSARHKGRDAATLEEEISRLNPEASVRRFGAVGDVVEVIKASADDQEVVYVVTGGIFSVMDFRTAFLGESSMDLRFF